MGEPPPNAANLLPPGIKITLPNPPWSSTFCKKLPEKYFLLSFFKIFGEIPEDSWLAYVACPPPVFS